MVWPKLATYVGRGNSRLGCYLTPAANTEVAERFTGVIAVWVITPSGPSRVSSLDVG